MTAELLVLLDSDPAAGILAVADLREQRATDYGDGATRLARQHLRLSLNLHAMSDYIAAEANPAHALAAVRRWRGVVERHRMIDSLFPLSCDWCSQETDDLLVVWPCPDLTETTDEARTYVGGTP